MTPTPVGAGRAGLNRSSAPSSFTTASFAHAEGDSCRPEGYCTSAEIDPVFGIW